MLGLIKNFFAALAGIFGMLKDHNIRQAGRDQNELAHAKKALRQRAEADAIDATPTPDSKSDMLDGM